MKGLFRKHRIQVIVGTLALVMLMAAVVGEMAVASNMAFKMNKAVGGGAGNFGVNFVALPFRTPIQNARDVCTVFATTNSAVLVQKLVGGGGAPLNYTCNQTGVPGFSLNDGGAPGLTGGVGLRIQNNIAPPTALAGIIVGSHIPGGGGPAGQYTQPVGPGKKLFAVPYHTTNVSAKDVCIDGGLDSVAPAASLRRINTATGTPLSFTCDQGVAGFALVLGEAVEISNQVDGGVRTWTPSHF